MDTSPPIVFFGTLLNLPFKLFSIIGLAALGAGLPLLIETRFDPDTIVGLLIFIPAIPVVLPIVAILSGFWGFIALPLVAVIFTKMFLFLKDQTDRYDILQVFLCAFLVSVNQLQNGDNLIAIAVTVPALLYTHKPIRDLIHGNKVEDPSTIEPWLEEYMQLDASQEVAIEAKKYLAFESLLLEEDWQQIASAWMTDRKVFRFVRQEEHMLVVHHKSGDYGLIGYSGTPGYLLDLLKELESHIDEPAVSGLELGSA